MNGQTRLAWAAENGKIEVVRRLLERRDVDPDAIDSSHGETPHWRAAYDGHDRILRMLLERVTSTLTEPTNIAIRYLSHVGHVMGMWGL